MRRRIFNFLALASVLLFIVVGALWVRSYWRLDSVYLESLDHGYLVSSSRGSIRAIQRDAVYASEGVQFASYEPLTFAEPNQVEARKLLGAATASSPFNGAPARWVVVPHWMPCVASAIVPLVWMQHRRLAARRSRAGFCRACGYDLRATPEQCPECGVRAAA